MTNDPSSSDSQLVIYQTAAGDINVEVRLESETVWLTQAHMAELFAKSRSTITEHIGNIFKEGELDEELVCLNFRHTTQHGAIEGKTQSKEVTYYNLDVIISVGYRVKSPGTESNYILNAFQIRHQRNCVPANHADRGYPCSGSAYVKSLFLLRPCFCLIPSDQSEFF